MADQAVHLVRILRPRQWAKNLLVLGPLLFAGQATNKHAVSLACLAFIAFCLTSSAGYVVNDLRDVEADRLHPEKRHRPIAAGLVSKRLALAIALASLSSGLLVSVFLVNWEFTASLSAYLALTLTYTAVLKHVVIVDVLCVATGFVLRAVGGALAIRVTVSPWLLVCTFLLALFVVLAKRRHELVVLDGSTDHRAILSEYSPGLLDQMISVVTPAVLLSYALYTVDETTIAKFGGRHLELTLVFVLYGLFRYLYLMHQKNLGGKPESLIFDDKPLLLSVVLWAVSAALIIYAGHHVFPGSAAR